MSKVQETADDAAISKCSAVHAGYYADPFIAQFLRKPLRRSPLINRGYFARIASVDLILHRFLAICHHNGTKSQVVSLGAGLDSTFWRIYSDSALAANSPTPATGVGMPALWVEVDFPDVTAHKAETIRRVPAMSACCAGATVTPEELAALSSRSTGSSRPHAGSATPSAAGTPSREAASPSSAAAAAAAAAQPAPAFPQQQLSFTATADGGCEVRGASGYRLCVGDLRNIECLKAALAGAGIDRSLPTLFLSECVLVYLEPGDSCAVIAWAASAFKRSVFVTYEQIRPHDAFGQVMCRSLEERGYKLRGLASFPDIPAQTQRYRSLGFTGGCSVLDMNDMYYRVLPRAMVTRCERLELFDELEEWHLMSAHYCIAVAVNEVGVGGGALVDDGMPAPAPKAPRQGGAGSSSSSSSVSAAAGNALLSSSSTSSSSAAAPPLHASASGTFPASASAPSAPHLSSSRRLSATGHQGGGGESSETSDSEAGWGGSASSARSSAATSRQHRLSVSPAPFGAAAVMRSAPSAVDGHSDTLIYHSHRQHEPGKAGGGAAGAGAAASASASTSAAAAAAGGSALSPSRRSVSRSKDSMRGRTLVSGSLEDAPDFAALEECEQEIHAGRLVREAAGIDAARESEGGGSGEGGGVAAAAAAAAAAAGAAAVTATAAAVPAAPRPRSYEANVAVDEAKAHFTLLDMLLPTNLAAVPSASSSGGGARLRMG